MPIEIVIDSQKLEEQLQRLKEVPYALQRAVYPAVSEVMQGVRTHLSEYLASDVPIDPKAAKRTVKLGQIRTSGESIVGTVTVKSGMLPLIYYDVQPQEVTARKGLHPKQWPDFTFSLRRGERRAGRSWVQGISLPFIARMPTGHLGVYYRTASQMKQAYGPTVQYHVVSPKVESVFTEKANRQFPEVLARYVDQALTKFGGSQ